MRIGVVPSVHRHGGGVFQYSLSLLHALERWRDEESGHQLVILEERPWGQTHRINEPILRTFLDRGWEICSLYPPDWRDPLRHLRNRLFGRGKRASTPQPIATQPVIARSRGIDEVHYQPKLQRYFESLRLDLIVYGAPVELAFECKIPFVFPVHDLQHRFHPEFPEVSANGEWDRREYVFRNGCRHALVILVDSEVGKEDVLTCYGEFGVRPEAIHVLPYLPSPLLRLDEGQLQAVRQRYELPNRFLFYPAQFWPHKNHVRLVASLGKLCQEKGVRIPLVLCGSAKGSFREQVFQEVKNVAASHGILSDLKILGYLPDQDVAALYRLASGLVFPTFFGPTNIPILEAWATDCPVLTSDIRGCREQAGDAAILVDPLSEESIANGIWQIWTNDTLREQLIRNGRRKLAEYGPDDFYHRLIRAIQHALDILERAGSKD